MENNKKMWVVKEVAQARYDTCKQCTSFIADTATCKECGCQMKEKVKSTNSECPLKKW